MPVAWVALLVSVGLVGATLTVLAPSAGAAPDTASKAQGWQEAASQLGSEQDTVQQVARGRIDMGGYSGGSAALFVPEIGLLLMPAYFKSAAEFD